MEGTGRRVCMRLWGRSTGPVWPLRHDSPSLLGVLTPEPVTGNVCKCWMGSFVTRSLGSGRVSLGRGVPRMFLPQKGFACGLSQAPLVEGVDANHSE